MKKIQKDKKVTPRKRKKFSNKLGILTDVIIIERDTYLPEPLREEIRQMFSGTPNENYWKIKV